MNTSSRDIPSPERDPDELFSAFRISLERLSPDAEFITTPFTERKIVRESMDVGGKSAKWLASLLEESGFLLTKDSRYMMTSRHVKQDLYEDEACTKLKNPEKAEFVRLRLADLGLKDGATLKQVMERAAALGLEVCHPTDAPWYFAKHKDDLFKEWVFMGMNPLANDKEGAPSLFSAVRKGDYLGFNSWNEALGPLQASHEFVFRLPTSRAQNTVSEEKV